ncbi:uncharacterized protein LOC128254976 [Drosophila gunungcola]|uniref:Uncharacterized protein n=1 Tax=Drosophila gunungcola TaxID=103775 RepID=A0A9P9YK61_9MUSC|nr:uncharacterized protein LOC128254976 [Drosophila gunungcola]KAI8038426.1 hypothetical protein M5D96_008324 [Drosophila gunungcola]
MWTLLILCGMVKLSGQVQYEFVLEDEAIFTKCKNAKPGTLDINGLYNMTNYSTNMVPEGIEISGNLTSVFNAEPSDRIEVLGSLLYFDRGSWQPTTLNMVVRDFCKVMYDKNQLWYKAWSSHITNSKDIENYCIKVVGTVFVMENYTLSLIFGSGMTLLNGRYTLQVEAYAIDKFSKKRPGDVCYEVIGSFYKT